MTLGVENRPTSPWSQLAPKYLPVAAPSAHSCSSWLCGIGADDAEADAGGGGGGGGGAPTNTARCSASTGQNQPPLSKPQWQPSAHKLNNRTGSSDGSGGGGGGGRGRVGTVGGDGVLNMPLRSPGRCMTCHQWAIHPRGVGAKKRPPPPPPRRHRRRRSNSSVQSKYQSFAQVMAGETVNKREKKNKTSTFPDVETLPRLVDDFLVCVHASVAVRGGAGRGDTTRRALMGGWFVSVSAVRVITTCNWIAYTHKCFWLMFCIYMEYGCHIHTGTHSNWLSSTCLLCLVRFWYFGRHGQRSALRPLEGFVQWRKPGRGDVQPSPKLGMRFHRPRFPSTKKPAQPSRQ